MALAAPFLGSLLCFGCPPGDAEPDADVDAMRIRRDTGPEDAPGLDAFEIDLDTGPSDAGPIPQCPGVPAPAMPCSNDDECRTAGLARCNLPTHGDGCGPCMGLMRECETDMDCVIRATTDAGPEFLDDAAFPEDAGPSPDVGTGPVSGRTVCVTYDRTCACPRTVCEAPCSGATCPNASCATDGYMCPSNSRCEPMAAVVDSHGCAPLPCDSREDCDCGFCTPAGLCANGAGTCEP